MLAAFAEFALLAMLAELNMELEDSLSYIFCSYCCKLRLGLIKHCLGTHSYEYTF